MKERIVDSMDRKPNAQEEAMLDERLNSASQATVAQMVASLPNEEPSVTWRRDLNVRVYEVAGHRERRQKLSWVLRPAVGLAMGAALAFAFLWTQPSGVSPASRPADSVEAQIAGAHREAVQLQEFWGSVRADEDVIPASVSAPATTEYRWDETDLGTL